MSFGKAVSTCLAKFVTFSGRAPRSEYWYFSLFNFIAIMVGVVIDLLIGTAYIENGELQGGLVDGIMLLVFLLPGISVSVRRLHDLNRSGWWIWIGLIPLIGGIVLLVWDCTKGTEGDNAYGPDPLFDAAAVFA